jgi:cytoskeletal protein CcmA (bactofilin family)
MGYCEGRQESGAIIIGGKIDGHLTRADKVEIKAAGYVAVILYQVLSLLRQDG